MLYLLDTANVDKIRHYCEYYPIDGVTTNPSIISRENTDFAELILNIRKTIGMERMLHIQTTSKTCDAIVKEAIELHDFVGGNLYIKIPISEEGLKATKKLKSMGIKVTETAIFTQQQALVAAKAGADFVAPYVNRLDNIATDGVNVVLETVELFERQHIETKVLAASFKTVEQIHKITLAGTQAITLNPELYKNLIYHPMTDNAIEGFERDWKFVYGERAITEILDNK